jgi:hypothetical protein
MDPWFSFRSPSGFSTVHWLSLALRSFHSTTSPNHTSTRMVLLHLPGQALTLRLLEGLLPICAFCKRIRKHI